MFSTGTKKSFSCSFIIFSFVIAIRYPSLPTKLIPVLLISIYKPLSAFLVLSLLTQEDDFFIILHNISLSNENFSPFTSFAKGNFSSSRYSNSNSEFKFFMCSFLLSSVKNSIFPSGNFLIIS